MVGKGGRNGGVVQKGVLRLTMQRPNRSTHSAHARQEFLLDTKKAFSWIANMYEYNGEGDPEASKTRWSGPDTVMMQTPQKAPPPPPLLITVDTWPARPQTANEALEKRLTGGLQMGKI